MGQVILGMSVSLDGFIHDKDGSVNRLYADLQEIDYKEQFQDAIRMSGAVIMGRRSYEMGNGDFTGYEFQTPIFVVTHQPPQQVAKTNTRVP